MHEPHASRWLARYSTDLLNAKAWRLAVCLHCRDTLVLPQTDSDLRLQSTRTQALTHTRLYAFPGFPGWNAQESRHDADVSTSGISAMRPGKDA
jgi:hypothetical protein